MMPRALVISLCCLIIAALGLVSLYIYWDELQYSETKNAVVAESPSFVDISSIPKSDSVNSNEYAPRVAAIINNKGINTAQRTDMLEALKSEFNDKKLHFTGTITELDSYSSHYVVKLTHENDYKAECKFDKNKRDTVYALRIGQSITVTGTLYFFTSSGETVSMIKCDAYKDK